MVPNAFTILCWTKIYMVHKKKLGDVKGRIALVSHVFWKEKLFYSPLSLDHHVGGKNLFRLNGKV